MEINGYELGGIAFMTGEGPLWATRSHDGSEALLALFSPARGCELEERWRAWAGVEHPGVVRLLDVVRHEDGRWALIEERAAGRPLDLLIDTPALRSRSARERIVAELADALLALHDAGIVHGDIAPANIVVSPEGRAVLVDILAPVGEGGGTPGWSLSERKDEEADWQALARIADALEVAVPGEGPVNAQAGADETGAECGADPAEEFRKVAMRAETLVVRPTRPVRALLVGIAACALLVTGSALVLVRGIAQADGAIGQSDAVPTSAGRAGNGACPSRDEAADEIEAILRARDAALVAGDPRLLEGSVGGALAAQDRERISSLAEAGARIEGLHTRVELLSDPSCSGQRRRVVARFSQEPSRICRGELCEEVAAPEAVELELALAADAWIALEASGRSD